MKIFNDYVNALNDEYQHLKGQQSKTPLTEGKLLYEEYGGFVYSFKLSKELGLPDNTPIFIYTNDNNPIPGTVIYVDAYEIILRTVDKKLDLNSKLDFSSSVYELIRKLKDKFMKIEENANELVKQLINGEQYVHDDENIKKGQNIAKVFASKNPITIIWGPPGTGKTHTLAEIALEFIDIGKSVLIVSQSNIAVDNAMLKVKEFIQKRSAVKSYEGKIFRAGYSKVREISEYTGESDFCLNAKAYVKKTNPNIINKLEFLQKEIREERHSESKRKQLQEEITQIRKQIHHIENEMIINAQMLGTTISKATMDEDISKRGFDVVLFDEASMAYVPQIVYACSLAKDKFVCIGDFRQLPPIVQNEEKSHELLEKDIFDYLGIFKGSKEIKNHEWLVMLDKQRRMNPKISKFIQYYIYSKHLTDYESSSDYMSQITNKIVRKGPVKDKVFGYFDIDSVCSTAITTEKGKRRSQSNLVSAFISVFIALKAKKEGQEKIAILSPYRHQVDLIKSILTEFKIGQQDGILCSSIHQFQGSETDVVIFDTVLTGKKKVAFLSNSDTTTRLINVALTRAKGKFIWVGSGDYNSKVELLNELWKYVKNVGQSIPIEEITDLKNYSFFSECKKIEKYLSIKETILSVKNDKVSVRASFNNDALNYNANLLTSIQNLNLNKDDYVFLDKDIEETKLKANAIEINEIINKGTVYKSKDHSDNVILINEKQTIFPIISKRNNAKEYVYIKCDSKKITSVIWDLQFEGLEKEQLSLMQEVQGDTNQKPIKCPKCGLNYIQEGEECCSVCRNQKTVAKTYIAENDRVTLRDICILWGRLYGCWVDKKKQNEIEKRLNGNKNIARIFVGKTTYYSKEHVFFEFFYNDKVIGPAIRKCYLGSYEELEKNIKRVQYYMDY